MRPSSGWKLYHAMSSKLQWSIHFSRVTLHQKVTYFDPCCHLTRVIFTCLQIKSCCILRFTYVPGTTSSTCVPCYNSQCYIPSPLLHQFKNFIPVNPYVYATRRGNAHGKPQSWSGSGSEEDSTTIARNRTPVVQSEPALVLTDLRNITAFRFGNICCLHLQSRQ
jgi:hypothetical protein